MSGENGDPERNEGAGEGQPTAGQPQAGGQSAAGGTPQGGQQQGGQTPGGQGAYAQPQQGGYQQPAGGGIFQKPAVKQHIKFSVASFGVLGIGAGLTILLVSTLMPAEMQLLQAMSIFSVLNTVFLLATLFAMVVGVVTGLEMQTRAQDTAAAAGVGSAAGAVGMLLVVFVFLMLSTEGGDTVGFGDLIAPMIGAAIGAGVTGAMGAYVTSEYPSW